MYKVLYGDVKNFLEAKLKRGYGLLMHFPGLKIHSLLRQFLTGILLFL